MMYRNATFTQNLTLNLYKCYNTLYPYLSMDTFGKRLRKVRKRNFMKQNEVSELIGYKYQFIANIENEFLYPSGNIIIALHKLFGDIICCDDYSKFIISNYPEKIKNWRTKSNLTQKDAAEILGVSPSTILKWEKGVIIKKYMYEKIKDRLSSIID